MLELVVLKYIVPIDDIDLYSKFYRYNILYAVT